MNLHLEQLRATLTKNKTALGALGVVAVGALAWRARSSSSTDGAGASSSSGSSSVTPSSYSTGGQGTYDSSSSDVYNAIQPQLEHLQELWDKNQSTPIPVPVTADAPTDSRRDAITTDYKSILGRDPKLHEVNYWDATGADLSWIRSAILAQPEAQGK